MDGKITINGMDLRDYPLDALRSRVALVSQDTYLFNERDIIEANPMLAPRSTRSSGLDNRIKSQMMEQSQGWLDIDA